MTRDDIALKAMVAILTTVKYERCKIAGNIMWNIAPQDIIDRAYLMADKMIEKQNEV